MTNEKDDKMRNDKWEMRNGKDDEMRNEEGGRRRMMIMMRKTGGWDEKTEFEMRKKGLEVSKKDSFGVDGFDSKKHVKVLIFGCLRTRQKL